MDNALAHTSGNAPEGVCLSPPLPLREEARGWVKVRIAVKRLTAPCGGVGALCVRNCCMHFGMRILLLVVASLMLSGCQKPGPQEAKPLPALTETVTLCRASTMLAPLVIAEKQGLFSGQGLTVTTKAFTMGKEAMEAMLRGECDFASAAEPPVVEYALVRDDFRVIGALQSAENMCSVVALAERGIGQPFDLRGKRIATVKGTAPHYFLELFFQKYHLSPTDVVIEFMKAHQVLNALTSGQVDAIAMTNKVTAQARQALAAKAVTFEAPALYRSYHMLLAMTGLLEKRPGVVVKFLKALAQAEEFIQQRSEEAQVMVQTDQNMALAEVKELWGMYDFRLTLDQSMLMGLEAIARWHLQQNSLDIPTPNFMKYLHTASLAQVRPEAINLVH